MNARDQELAENLTRVAKHYTRLANAITEPSSDLRKFYREKAQHAIEGAAQLIAASRAAGPVQKSSGPGFDSLVKAAEYDLRADKTNDKELAGYYREQARNIRKGGR
jgi:hypothetical protein